MLGRMTVLTLLVYVGGCGSSHFALPKQRVMASRSDSAASAQTTSGTVEGQEPDAALPPNPVIGAPIPLPPVPITGSYLWTSVVDASGIPIANADVVFQENGQAAVTSRSDAMGRALIKLILPENVTTMSVRTASAGAASTIPLTLSDTDKSLLKTISYDATLGANHVPAKVLRILTETTGIGGRLVLSESMNPATDTVAPQAKYSFAEGPAGITVTIQASDSGAGLHPEPYSYDFGATWTSQNSKIEPLGTVFRPGQLRVRDLAGNVVQSTGTIAP